MKIGIVGLGLIGGSMARSIKLRTAHTVWGCDSNSAVIAAARRSGAIDAPLTDEDIAACDLLLVALLPGDTVAWVSEKGRLLSPQSVLLDLCGIKRAIHGKLASLAGRYGFTYIGGHPMAGRERGGFANSSADLFDGAAMILTPGEDAASAALEGLKELFTAIGFAGLTITTPEEHDRIIAYTSQLAHLVSSAYVKSPAALRRCGFSAGSFRDLTRVARLDPAMWTELMMSNADFLAGELELLLENLAGYRRALREGDRELLYRLLQEGREKKILAGGS